MDKGNRRVQGKLAGERPLLRPLPPAAVPEYTTWRTKVKSGSAIRVANRIYSVPSRLCGHEVEVRQSADYLEVYDALLQGVGQWTRRPTPTGPVSSARP